MIKLIRTSDHDLDAPTMQLVDIHSRGVDSGWLQKTAAVLTSEIAGLRPSAGKTYAHVLALGATEKFGPNRNGDGFKRADCKACHHRFVKSGRFHKNHDNKDPAKAVGKIIHSAYNEPMDRVELIVELDNLKAAGAVQKLASGKDLSVSMGCRVAFDTCSICGHRAPSPKEYCDHAKLAMTQILEDGRQVYVDNPNPDFFECSEVGRGADRIGLCFRKVASDHYDHEVKNSVELAKVAGLYVPAHIAVMDADIHTQRKFALLRKLSEMEKEIETNLTPMDTTAIQSMPSKRQLNTCDINKMMGRGNGMGPGKGPEAGRHMGRTMNALHEAKVLVPLRDFLQMMGGIGGFDADDVEDDVEHAMPGIFGRMLKHEPMETAGNSVFDGEPGNPLAGVGDIINKMLPEAGMGMPQLQRRITITVIKPKSKLASAMTPRIDDPLIDGLARLYGTYKLSFLSHPANQDDSVLTRTIALQSYSEA